MMRLVVPYMIVSNIRTVLLFERAQIKSHLFPSMCIYYVIIPFTLFPLTFHILHRQACVYGGRQVLSCTVMMVYFYLICTRKTKFQVCKL